MSSARRSQPFRARGTTLSPSAYHHGRVMDKSGGSSNSTDIHRIEIPKIKNLLERLKPYISTKISDLPKDLKDDFNNFAIMTSMISDVNYYNVIVDLISTVFGRIENVVPESVGAFARGCFEASKFPGLQACSATCAGMMTPPENVSGWAPCDKHVITFDGVELSILQKSEDKPHTDEAIIHVTNVAAFRGFTEQHIMQLRQIGIKDVSLYFFHEGGKYTEKLKSRPLSDLPLAPKQQTQQAVVNSKPPPPPHYNNNSNDALIWAFVIFFGLFILGMIAYAMKKK